jgi:hypothetical protein
MTVFNEGAPKSPSESLQYDEICRRLQKLQKLGLLGAVRPLLDKYDAKQIDTLHPRHYGAFRAGLMRLGVKKGRAA